MIHPFSVLDTRTKEWKLRKQYWIETHNIKSELGREDLNSNSGFWEDSNYVSIFDPVLTEKMYEWFCPKGGTILDPFAGGSVRGIVAEEMGYKYTGIELSNKQVFANIEQSKKPRWIAGDSVEVLQNHKDEYDFIFTCPPYHDLEVYSDNPKDISTKSYDDFIQSLEYIMALSAKRLRDNRFIGIVVSEIRELGKTRDYKKGTYKGFVSDVIKFMEKHDLYFYNDMVLFNSQHQASRTGGTYFKRNRKIASVHQNILIFVKGNPDLATEVLECDGTYECTVDGVDYRSFREAAIAIDPVNIIGSEIKRRCKSKKSKYQNYQIFNETTLPVIKYVIDGIPFEDIPSINKKTGIIESEIYNKIVSNNPITRHWKKNNKDGVFYGITYKGLKLVQEKNEIRSKIHTIQCEGIDFYTTYNAGVHFGLSKERIRQKLNDVNFPDYFYLYSKD